MTCRRPPHRLATLLLALHLALAATAPAGATVLPGPGPAWPEPKPQPGPVVRQPPAVLTVPDFQAPSAEHCARPVATREVPGGGPSAALFRSGVAKDALAKSAREEGRADTAAAPAGAGERAFAPPAPPGTAPRPAGIVAPPLAQSLDRRDAPQDPLASAVTAGVVDDNADFAAYLGFRQRNPVAHRPREVRERYLLEVKDARGGGVVDAEVAVQAPGGATLWARTDAAGRAWVHPDAFDAARSREYQVTVRKAGQQAFGRLVRGQRSAVEVTLDAPAEAARAKLDLVFLVDATGSMADEIDKLKATLRTITREVAAMPSRPDTCLGLVAYRDRGDAFLYRSHDFTNDVGGFLRDALMPLQAAGGGDYPEAMNDAFHEAVHQLSWRGSGTTRLVVLLADAPPHLDYGAPHYDDDMLVALGKGIKVFAVGASGLDRQGEFIQRQIAQFTGGRFVFLTYADARRPGQAPGRETSHDVKNYSVETLDRLIVRLVGEELAKRGGTGG